MALARERGAVLVDVRSRPEWSFVGVPDLASISKRPVLVAWQHWTPGPQGAVMAPNAAFAEELAAVVPSRDAPVVFICRSGARSRAAAIANDVRASPRPALSRPTSNPVAATRTFDGATTESSTLRGSEKVASPIPLGAETSNRPSIHAGTSGAKPVAVQIPSPHANVP